MTKTKNKLTTPLTKTIIIIFAERSLALEKGFQEEFCKDLATCCSVVTFTKSMNSRIIYSFLSVFSP